MARSTRSIPILVFAGFAIWIFWLRWPSFGGFVWNLDEGIHATIARTILDGGVMYRDAIDQRTPLSYYLVAGIFAFSGVNNLWAVPLPVLQTGGNPVPSPPCHRFHPGALKVLSVGTNYMFTFA